MKCRKCGTLNEDDKTRCSNCGASLYPVWDIKILWKSVLSGVIAGVLVLLLGYSIYGTESWFPIAILYSMIVAAMIAAIFARRDEYPPSRDDINCMVNSFLTCVIISFPLELALFDVNVYNIIGALVFAVGAALFGLIGAALGYLIVVLNERRSALKLMGIMGIVLIVTILGYLIFFSNLDNEMAYENNLDASIDDIYLVDAIDQETSMKLNGSLIYNVENETFLKDLDIRYQRVINLTEFSLDLSQEASQYASSDIETEYADALLEYSKLRLDYFTLMEKSVNLTLEGNITEAKKYYYDALTIIPLIIKQNETLGSIENKDTDFQKRIQSITKDSLFMVNNTKRLNVWMDPDRY